jgi:hypothetical protein
MTNPMHSRISWAARLGLTCTAIAQIAAACESPTRPGNLPEVVPTTYVGTGPEGLKQTLFITPPKSAIDDPTRLIEVESTVTNTGGLSVNIITRSCVLLPEDLISADGVIFVPENPPDCGGRTADTLALAPGESTPTLVGVFSIEGTTPGVYNIDLRHVIKPAFLTRFRFRMPGAAASD